MMKISEKGLFGTGLVFLPEYSYEAVLCMEVITKFIREEGLELIEYHDLPVSLPVSSKIVGGGETHVAQVLIKANLDKDIFEKKLGLVRKLSEQQISKSKLKHRQSFSVGNLSAIWR